MALPDTYDEVPPEELPEVEPIFEETPETPDAVNVAPRDGSLNAGQGLQAVVAAVRGNALVRQGPVKAQKSCPNCGGALSTLRPDYGTVQACRKASCGWSMVLSPAKPLPSSRTGSRHAGPFVGGPVASPEKEPNE